jgi:hypothetical protein
MTIGTNLSVADRIAQLLDHLGIERAHFAASIWRMLQASRRRIRNGSPL